MRSDQIHPWMNDATTAQSLAYFHPPTLPWRREGKKARGKKADWPAPGRSFFSLIVAQLAQVPIKSIGEPAASQMPCSEATPIMVEAVGDVMNPAPPKVTYRSVLKHDNVKILAASRAAAKMAGSTLSYGAMVYLAQIGSSQIQISSVSAAQYLAAVIFGMQGGVLADSLSKRFALLIGFCAQTALCILIPFFLGTEFGALLMLMFLTSILSQIISPSLKAAVSIVSSPRELATCAALVSLIGSIASAIGSGFIAPILMKRSSIDVVLAVAGVLYFIGAIRAYKLPNAEKAMSVDTAIRTVDWKPQALSIRFNAKWVYEHRPVASMMLIYRRGAPFRSGERDLHLCARVDRVHHRSGLGPRPDAQVRRAASGTLLALMHDLRIDVFRIDRYRWRSVCSD
jgi:hypothetical protein